MNTALRANGPSGRREPGPSQDQARQPASAPGRDIRAANERIGNVFYSEGKLPEAQQYYQQSLKFDQQINDPQGLASDYGNLANALGDLGDLAGSLKMQQKALAAFEQIGDRRGSAATMANPGNLLAELGDLVQARSYEQTRALAKPTSSA